MRQALILLLFIFIKVSLIPVTYGFSSRIFKFSQTTQTQWVSVPHYPSPMILYCLTSISISGYFYYNSNHTLTPSNDQSNLTISVSLDGTNTYNLAVSYIYMESMPNMQVMFVNLTHLQKTITLESTKKLAYDENTYISAHLVGFSSSKNTYNTFYHTWRGNTSYAVYTKSNLKDGDWITLNLVILQDNYDMNNTICIGSYINSESNVSSMRSPLRLDIEPQLHFILGIEAIVLANAQFAFNRSTQSILMNQTGTYSFSIIVINNTCNYVFDYEAYEQNRMEKLYLGLMITFISIFVILVTAMAIYCKDRVWWDAQVRYILVDRIYKSHKRIPVIMEEKRSIRNQYQGETEGINQDGTKNQRQNSLELRIAQQKRVEMQSIQASEIEIDDDAPQSNGPKHLCLFCWQQNLYAQLLSWSILYKHSFMNTVYQSIRG